MGIFPDKPKQVRLVTHWYDAKGNHAPDCSGCWIEELRGKIKDLETELIEWRDGLRFVEKDE